jgi:hypothetical protein
LKKFLMAVANMGILSIRGRSRNLVNTYVPRYRSEISAGWDRKTMFMKTVSSVVAGVAGVVAIAEHRPRALGALACCVCTGDCCDGGLEAVLAGGRTFLVRLLVFMTERDKKQYRPLS